MKVVVVSRSKVYSDEMNTLGLYTLSCNRIPLATLRHSWAQKVTEGVRDPFNLFHESVGDLAIVQHGTITR